jgi:hypothetical protein
MFPKKQKCNFDDSLKVEFPFIQLVNFVCGLIFSISSGGMTSITDHRQAKKHKNVLLAKSPSGCMTNCFRELTPSKAEYGLAVHEGTYTYHAVSHYRSFRSTDCTSLQKKFADKKISFVRTSANQSLATFMLLELLNGICELCYGVLRHF